MQNNQNDWFRVVFIGDVTGKYGRRFMAKVLPLIKIKFAPDVVIANGENSAGGLGIIPKTASEMFRAGVDIISTGNHVWDKKEGVKLLAEEGRILRPLNFPPAAPGKGDVVFESEAKGKILIVNLQGRVFMEPVVDNPFLIMDAFLKEREGEYKVILLDFHAEATAEKQAMGFFLDGRVSAVLGTHTHVQTTDLRILAQGTAYQTDVGMAGPLDSVIGMRRGPVIKKFLTGINQKFEVARGNLILDMTIVDIDPETGKAVHAELHRIYNSTYEEQLD